MDLFKDIKITKGYSRSLLVDTTKGNIEFFSNDFYNLLTNLSDYKNITELTEKNPEFKEDINLLKKNYVFNENILELENFIEYEDTLESPFTFYKISIDFDKFVFNYLTDNFDIYKLTDKFIIHIYNLEDILTIKKKLDKYKHIVKYLKIHNDIIELKEILRIYKLDETYELESYKDESKTNLNKIKLLVNNNIYLESKQFYSSYKNMLHINKNGDLKFNPENEIIIGNILEFNNNNINDLTFNEYTNININDVMVCKDCEFRHFCLDKQDVIKTTFDKKKYYKKKECEYNPYICKWSHEDDYLNLEYSGITSNANIFEINLEKFNQIFNKLWN
jgi:hypothetical protein